MMSDMNFQPTPRAAKVSIAAAVIQVIAAVGAFLGETFESAPLLMVFAVGGMAALAAAVFVFQTHHRLCRLMRALMIGLPSAVALIGPLCAVYTVLFRASMADPLNLSMSAADTPFWYTLMFDLSVTLTYAQMIVLFLLPAMTAAATFGERFDRRALIAAAFLHLAVMAANVLYFSQQFQIPTWNMVADYAPSWSFGTMEITLVQAVMLAISAVYAVTTLFVGNKKSAETLGA